MPLPDPLPLEIDVETLDRVRRAGEDVVLLDVREPHELAICGFAEARHIPLGQLAARADEVPQDRPVVVVCRSGARSMTATRYLRERGLVLTTNLRGGVLAWGESIDPSWDAY